MATIVYVIIREGVYRNSIVGVYQNLLSAKRCAKKAIKAENDDYHEFTINEAVLNKMMMDVKPIINYENIEGKICVTQM